MRKINGKLFLALLVGTAALTAAVFAVHHFQYRRIGRALLFQARRAEEAGQVVRMARYLQRYLEFNPRDHGEKARLGRAWAGDAFAGQPRARAKAATLIDEVLTYDDDPDLRRLVVKLSLELRDTKRARDHLERLLPWQDVEARLRKARPRPDAEDPALGELEGYWGQLLQAEDKKVEAVACYRLALRHAPHHQVSYVRLAYLLRRHPETNPEKRQQNIAEADAVIDRLVARAAGPDAAKAAGAEPAHEAFLARWRYRRDFDLLAVRETAHKGQVPLEAAAEDVAAALKRGPEGVDALLAAADLERLRARAAAEATSADPAKRRAAVGEHRGRALGHLVRGLALLDKQDGPKSDYARFQLLWHKANLLLDDLDRVQADGGGPARVGVLRDEVRQTIAAVVKAGMPAAAEYLRGRVLLDECRWAEAATLFERARALLAAEPDLACQANLYLGRCYERLEEPKQMYEAYRRVADWDPSSVPAQLGMAKARWSQGKLDDAVAQYRRVLGRPQVPARALIDVARLELQRQLLRPKPVWDVAEQVLTEAEKANPDAAAEVALLRAELRVQQGKPGEAETLIRAALAKHGRDAALWAALSDLALRGNKPGDARKVLAEARGKAGDGATLRLAQARLLAAEGKKTRTAISKLADNAGAFGEDDQARLLGGLAEVQYRAGHAAEARALWVRMARLPKQRADLRLRLLLFDLAMKAGDEEGMDACLEDIRAAEQSAGTYSRYGRALKLIWLASRSEKAREAHLGEAALELDRVLSQRPSWPPVFLARAEIAELRGKPEQAIKDLQAAIANGEASAATVRRLVTLLAQRGRDAEADDVLRRHAVALRASADLRRVAVDVWLRRGKKDEALELTRGDVRDDSNDPKDLLWGARVLAMAGQPDQAEAKLKKAVEVAGSDPMPWLAMVQFLASQKRTKDALGYVKKAEAELPPEKAPLALARCYEALGKTKEARAHFEEALKKSDDVAVARTVATFHLNAGRHPEAEPLLRKIAARGYKGATADDVAWARRGLASVLASGTDYARFAEALRLVGLKLDADGRLTREGKPDDSPEGRRAQARVLASQSQGQFRRKAIELLEGLAKQRALRPEDQYVLALLYDAEGDKAKSRTQLRELVQAPVRTPQYLAQYALNLLAQRRLPDDLKEAEKVIGWLEQLERQSEAEPNTYASVELRARLLEARGTGDEAAALLKKHTARAGAKPDEVVLLLASLGRQKRYAEAFALCEQVWKEGRCTPEAAGGVGVALLRVMKPTDAEVGRVEGRLVAALKDKPKSTVLRMHLADLYDGRGRYADAEAAYRKILELEPSNVVALNNLAWLLAQRAGDAEKALAYIDRAVKGLGRRPDLLDTRGLVYLALKRPDKALADFKEATAEAPTAARLLHLARAHHQARDAAGAARALRAARAKGLQVAALHPVERGGCEELLREYKVR